jgi:hypothetical protein
MWSGGSLFAFSGATRAAHRASHRHREQLRERHAVELGEAEQRSDREVLLSGFRAPQVDDRNAELLGGELLRPALLSSERRETPADSIERAGFGLHPPRVRSVESGKQKLASCCFCEPSSGWRSLADHSPEVTRSAGGVKMSVACPLEATQVCGGRLDLTRCSAAGGTFNDGAISYQR